MADYGKTFRFDQGTVFTADPEMVHDLLVRTNTDFMADQSPFSARIDLQQAAADAELWMSVRQRGWKGLNRRVSIAHIVRLRQIFEDVIDPKLGTARSAMSVGGEIFSTAIVDYCLGYDSGKVLGFVSANTDALSGVAGFSTLLPEWMPTRKIKTFKAARKQLLDALESCVCERANLPSHREPNDLLDGLLQDPSLTQFQIQRFIRSLLLAAHGVPAAAMSWIISELLVTPDRIAYLRAEIDAYSDEQLMMGKNSPRVEAFVKEVLRLWPPTWLLGRTALHSTTLGQWPIRPNETVTFSPYIIQRDPDTWEQAEEFKPERWLDGKAGPARHTYLPFGAGPRVCVGAQIGMMQLAAITSWLVRDYSLTAVSADGARPSFQGLLAPNDLRVAVVRRDR